MNCRHQHVGRPACLGLALLLASTAPAQGPENPPPWWGVNDEVTVSLTWDFDVQFQTQQLPTLAPSFAVVPTWYTNPQPFSPTGAPLQWLASLNGHQGVLALVGNNTPLQADLELFVDNDPHLDWVKIFWFQFDVFEGASGTLEHELKRQLSKYGRASVTVETAPLANGWEQVTVSAELIPQPDDEDIDFTFLQTALGTTAIDNLHVSSKCVKPRPDEDGEPLGKVMNRAQLAPTGLDCRAVAITRDPAGGRRFWTAALGPTSTAPHVLFEVDANGAPLGNVVQLPSSAVQAPLGPMDMSVERVRQPGGGFVERVYVLLRNTAGDLRVRAFDPSGLGALVPALDTVILAPAAPIALGQRLGLAFDPTGDGGLGSFWITGRQNAPPFAPKAFEFTRGGVQVDEFDVPPETFGFDYDETLGNFYCFTRDPVTRPNGSTIAVNGVEISGYDRRPTGVRFCGDLTVPNPGGPPGGEASGMTLARSFGGVRSELRFACVVDTAQGQVFTELAGPFRYGYSRFGTIGMDNAPPFVGGAFDVTLRGVPNSVFAMLFLGSDDAITPLSPGIQAESVASLVPSVSSPLLTPVAPGRFVFPIGLPNTPGLAYAEAYFQWVVLDTTAPGFLGFSQAGKTVVYP